MSQIGRNALRFGSLAILVAGASLTLSFAGASEPSSGAVTFPHGFRQWMHVKSAVVWPETTANANFSGLHNIYANELAMVGYRTGQYPDGATIVFDLFEVQATSGAFEPSRRKAVDVMVRDSRAPKGWVFERFWSGVPTNRADAKLKANCLSCHLGEEEGDMVFSKAPEPL